MPRSLAAALGFALGAAVCGIGASAVDMAVQGRLPADADGSVGAAVMFAVIAFGVLGVVGGIGMGVVIGAVPLDISAARVTVLAAMLGAAVALAASLGLLPRGGMIKPSIMAGAVAAVVLIAAHFALPSGPTKWPLANRKNN